MSWTIAGHLAYLAICVPLIVWVGRTLSHNGQVFLTDVFGREDLATATNRLLLVGFYLLNLGFVLLYLRIGSAADSAQGLIETLSVKVGVVLLVLGAIHVVNVKVFSTLRRRHVAEDRQLQAYRTQLDAWATRQQQAEPTPAP